VVVIGERVTKLIELIMAKATKESRELETAIERGLDFIDRFSKTEKCLVNYGSFLICCFALVSATSRDRKLRRLGRDRAQQLLQRWSRMHPNLPDNASSDLLLEFVLVRYAQRRLGLKTTLSAANMRAVARRFSASALLGFDPCKEPPPNDLSYPCDCTFQNPRGRKACKQCKRRLHIRSSYKVWMEALANTYVAEQSAVVYGARYVEVLRWAPFMRPYPTPDKHSEEVVRDAIYAATHIVYTLNGYGTCKLSQRWLKEEFSFLKANVEAACERHDPEILGELLDSLKAFGLHPTHPLIVHGTDFLLANQNEDGSWGNPDEENLRTRCHTTWTAVDALRSYAWRGEPARVRTLKALLR